MKFTIKKNDLINCLKKINNLINENNINPTLSSVHIKSIDKKLFFLATNGENSYQEIIECDQIQQHGDILVKAKLLYNYISKINQDTITINQIDEKIIQINTPNSTSEINLIDNSSFPIIDFEYNDCKKITLSLKELILIQQKIKPFVSTNQSNINPSITGILFNSINEKEMECIASDSFRVAYHKFNYEGDNVKFVIEPKSIDMAIENLIISKKEYIDFYINEKKCILSTDNTLIQFSLFNKNIYPNIINTILSKYKNSFTLKLKNFINALNRGSVFVSNEQKPIANFKIENKKLTIKFLSINTGNSFEQIDILEGNFQDFNFKLNQKLLSSILNTIDSENITFNFENSNSPIIISSDNPNFLNLITPIKSL